MKNSVNNNPTVDWRSNHHRFLNLRLTYTNVHMLFLYFLFFVNLSSCKKFIEIPSPTNQLNRLVVFDNDRTALATLMNVYSKLSNGSGFFDGGASGFSLLAGLTTDELVLNTEYVNQDQFFENRIINTNPLISNIWNSSYNIIYSVNAIIEGLEKSKNITPALKKQIIGEAKFIRALVHFYLLNTFGSIPYVKSSDYKISLTIGRQPSSDVYEFIKEDLIEAKTMLANDYSFSNDERTRATKYAAAALLSRVYLFNEEWIEAENEAASIINNTDLFSLLNTLENVFLANSRESIMQFGRVGTATWTNEGNTFTNPDNQFNYSINENLLESFESTDERLHLWTASYLYNNETKAALYKYKTNGHIQPVNEYSTLFRLAEQYLIRAEARVEQNNLIGSNSAISDLDIIRVRAGLDYSTATSKDDILAAIIAERRHELFGEYGARLIDLKRRGLIDAALSIIKPNWDVNDKLYPIPESETLINPKIPQNPGY